MRQFGPDRLGEIQIYSFKKHESGRETSGAFRLRFSGRSSPV